MSQIAPEDFDQDGAFRTDLPPPADFAFRGPPPPALRANPLQRYFRLPGVTTKLPTGGAFLPPGALDMSPTGEVQVFPVRAQDELLLKNPDALMSGFAIEKLLESCVPGLHTPRLIAPADLDVLLLAMRAATYGPKMPVSCTCPECEAQNDYECDLPTLLATMTMVPPENPVKLGAEVVAYLRPYTLDNAAKLAMVSFEETRKLQQLEVAGAADETKRKALNESWHRLKGLTFELMGDCILAVQTPEGVVRDPEAIADFARNIPKPWQEDLLAVLQEINERGIDRHMPAVCVKCQHEWPAEVEFDPARFFEPASSQPPHASSLTS